MKKRLCLLLAALLVLSITACGAEESFFDFSDGGDLPQATPTGEPSVTAAPDPAVGPGQTPKPAAGPDETIELLPLPGASQKPETPSSSAALAPADREAFVKVLTDLVVRSLLPDGSACELMGDSLEDNQFALHDVDKDGKLELILLFSTSSMAGMRGYVLGCENGNVTIELSAFPSFEFYENGNAKAMASHNHSYSMEFWPYSAYEYCAETDTYDLVGYASGWDEDMERRDEAFPAEVDKSGAGTVYFIDESGPMDESIYTLWEQSLFEGDLMDIEYRYTTQENIDRLKTGQLG